MSTKFAKNRTCANGHLFIKSSDCPTCPHCKKEKGKINIFSFLSAPARRAIENAGVKSLNDLAIYSEKELLQLHGIGPSSIPKIKKILSLNNLELRN